MRRTRKLLLIGLVAGGIAIFLLVTILLVAHLMANREMVKDALVSAAVRATGGQLNYSSLDVGILPMPHLEVTGLDLHREGMFSIKVRRLSVYPAVLPALTGHIRIRRLRLDTPDIRITPRSPAMASTPTAPAGGTPDIITRLEEMVTAPLGILAAVEPGTRWHIKNGRIIIAPADAPDIRINDIEATLTNTDDHLRVDLEGVSPLAGTVRVDATADLRTHRADGTVSLGEVNLRPICFHADLPFGIRTSDTRAAVNLAFHVRNADLAEASFHISMPQLTVMRGSRRLALAAPSVRGTLRYTDRALALSIDAFQTRKPALDLTAAARLDREEETGRPHLTLHAGAAQLDIALAGDVTRAIAGDTPSIRTAFSVAREGLLTNAEFTADLMQKAAGWSLTRMAASGHLRRGRITLPGIDTDLEQMAGDVAWADTHVDFKSISGRFKGIQMEDLDASIDWAGPAHLHLDTDSARIDAAVFYPWLTGFDGLSDLTRQVSAVDGTAILSRLSIDGPLASPQAWQISVTGTPQQMRLESPYLPFPVNMDGGEVTCTPENQQTRNVQVRFLDGAFSVSLHAGGFTRPVSLDCRLDGSMGSAAIDWLGTLLPIPGYLLVQPPVTLEGVDLGWDGTDGVTLNGTMKSAGGANLSADVTRSADAWNVRTLRFTDGPSTARLSARSTASGFDLTFSGHVEKAAVDRLLIDNRVLSGYIDGDFESHVDIAAPLRSTFSGTLSGSGVHLHAGALPPVDIHHFAVDGAESQINITPSQLTIGSSLMTVSGVLADLAGNPVFDLGLDADRLDASLLHRLFAAPEAAAVKAKDRPAAAAPLHPRGTIHLKTRQFAFDDFTWSPLKAEIAVDGRSAHAQILEAALCGISTTGSIDFTPDGIRLDIIPSAAGASLQETANCLLPRPVTAKATFDLSGNIHLPPTTGDIARALTGQVIFTSENGRIVYSSVLMKIFSVLNVTEVFTGGKTDLVENGYGYSRAYAKAIIGDGSVKLEELLLDGNSLKITGQGTIDLVTRKVDVTLLAAPLKTVDRIIDKIPIINYITGGTLISVPMRVHGNIDDPSVTPMDPSAVGRGLLGIMGRVLNAPFKLVQSAADLATGKAATPPAPSDAPAGDASQP